MTLFLFTTIRNFLAEIFEESDSCKQISCSGKNGWWQSSQGHVLSGLNLIVLLNKFIHLIYEKLYQL